MPNTDEEDPLGPGFRWRLRAALERVEPSFVLPRYGALRHYRPLRVTAAVLAFGAVGMVALSAFAATGSPNPAVWRERIVTTLESSPTATPTSESGESRGSGAAVPRHAASPAAQHSEHAEPTNRPEPTEFPGPASGERQGSDS